MRPLLLLLLALVQAPAPSRAELLADLAVRRREAGTDAAARVAVARWGFEHGLLAESVAELDAVLGRDPDHAAAREAIAGAPLLLSLPATAERTLAARLVLFGARARPAYRELAASRLAGLPEGEVEVELARAFRSPSPSVRAFSAFAARRTGTRSQADALVRRAVLDPSDPVRLEAARALRDLKDESLARRVESALGNADTSVRVFAARSLGEMGYRSSVPAIAARLAAASSNHPGGTRAHIRVGNQVAYVQDFNVEIAQGSSIADPIVNTVDDATQLDVRVGGTSSQRIELEGTALCRALSRLTGENLPEKTSAWLDWWNRNQGRFADSPSKPSTGR